MDSRVCAWDVFFAPNSFNYHLEHNLLPAVPKHRHAKFHRALRAKGLLDHAVLDRIITKQQAQAA